MIMVARYSSFHQRTPSCRYGSLFVSKVDHRVFELVLPGNFWI